MTVNRIIDAVRVRDQLGKPDSQAIFGPFRKLEKVKVSDNTKVYKRGLGNSFILGHTTLGRLRTDKNFEADCSDNGNHGTWNGTGIDGAQYISPAYVDTVLKLNLEETPTLNVVDDLSLEDNDGEYKINVTALYDMTDGSGTTLTDNSVNSNTGTITGATWTTDHLGNSDSALDFSVLGDKVDIASIDLTTIKSFSVTYYCRDISTANSNIIRSTASSGFTWTKQGTNDWQIYMRSTDGNSYRFGSMTPALNTWTTDTFSFNDTTKTLAWTRDSAIVQATQASNYNVGTTQSQAIRIGDHYTVKPDMIISELILVGATLTTDEMLNLYNVTKEHKLTNPLVTKTDSNGNSITGYEFSSLQTGSPSLETAAIPINFITTDYAFYSEINLEYKSSSRPHLIIGSFPEYGITSSHGSATLYGIGGWYAGNYSSTPKTLEYGKKYKVLVQYHANSSTREVYVDNVLYWTQTGGTPTNYNLLMRLGFDSSYTSYDTSTTGVIAPPIIIGRVLTSTERDALFAGTDSALLQPVQRLSAGKLNGTDNYVSATSTNIDPSAGLSLCIFQQADSASGNSSNHLFGISNLDNGGSGNNYFKWENDTTLRFKMYGTDGNTTLDATPTKSPNEKAFYCAVYDGTNMYIYEDGVLLNSTAKTWTTDANYTIVTVGANSVGTGGYFAGMIDEAMIFNTTLTTTDLQDIRENKFYSNHSKYGNCVLWYSMDNPVLGNYKSNNVLIEETDN